MKTKISPRFYKPGLDILRFIAFLLVFILHLSYFGYRATGTELRIIYSSSVGLSLFFTLSAYLITELLLREKESTGDVHLKQFFLRRILRIWPLYLAFLLGVFLWQRHFSPHEFTLHALEAYLLFSGNWYSFFCGWVPIVSAMWSISVEEQFYLLWPFTARFLNAKGLLTVCLLIVIGSLATIGLYALQHRPYTQVWSSSFTQFLFFAAGSLLAILLHGRDLRLTPSLRVAGVVLSAILAIVANARFHIVDETPRASFAVAGYLLMAISCVLLILSLEGVDVPKAGKPFIYFGKISYGLYVFHLPVLLVVKATLLPQTGRFTLAFVACAALAGAITLLLAATSYHFYEKPFLSLKHRFTLVRSRPD